MLIRGFVEKCDSCAVEFNGQGGHAVAQGATGRWCVVLHLCPKCTNLDTAISYEEAHKQIETELGGWADF
jgi:hypothetical protein